MKWTDIGNIRLMVSFGRGGNEIPVLFEITLFEYLANMSTVFLLIVKVERFEFAVSIEW